MDKDLELFNQLVKDGAPDCEVGETAFAYTSLTFTVKISKVSETDLGTKKVSMYIMSINGALNYTRFVNNLENAMTKAYFLINGLLDIKSREERLTHDEEVTAGSRYTSGQYEY
jgi:hypothetical protein